MAKKLAKWLVKVVVNALLFVIATIIVATTFYYWGQSLQLETRVWLMFVCLSILATVIILTMEKVWKRVLK